MATDYPHVYPELIGYRNRDRSVPPPAYPDACPVCAAPVTPDFDHAGSNAFRGPLYTCGGQYTLKPQIQNHTDYYWGTCPPKAEEVRVLRTKEALVEGAKALKVIAYCTETRRWLEANDPMALRQVESAIRKLDGVPRG